MKKCVLLLFLLFSFGCQAKPDSQSTVCDYEIIFDQVLGYQLDENSGALIAIPIHVAKRDSLLVAKSQNSCFDGTLQKNAKATLKNSDRNIQYQPEEKNRDEIQFEVPYKDVDQGDLCFEIQIGNVRKKEVFHTVEIPPKDFLIVPLQTSEKQSTVIITDAQLKNWHDEILKRLPLSQNGLQLTLQEDINVTSEMYDMNTWFGRLHVWNLLKQLKEETAYDGIIGLTSEKMDLDGQLDALSGFTFGGDTTVILEDSEETAVTITHEISHFYQIGDEYAGGQLNSNVNMPPYGMIGTDMLHPGTVAKGTNQFIQGGKNDKEQGSGTLVTVNQLPYDCIEHKLIPHDMTSYMGKDGYSMQEYWTTGPIWNHLIQEWRISSDE